MTNVTVGNRSGDKQTLSHDIGFDLPPDRIEHRLELHER